MCVVVLLLPARPPPHGAGMTCEVWVQSATQQASLLMLQNAQQFSLYSAWWPDRRFAVAWDPVSPELWAPIEPPALHLLHVAEIDSDSGVCKVLDFAGLGGTIALKCRHTIAVHEHAGGFTFSPSGQHLAFVNTTDHLGPDCQGALVIISMRTSARVEVRVRDPLTVRLQWSTDGRSLAVEPHPGSGSRSGPAAEWQIITFVSA